MRLRFLPGRQHLWCVFYHGLFWLLFQCVNGTGYWTNTNASISTVDFVSGVWSSATTCFMVGHNDLTGAIIRSLDGGYTWKNILTGTTKSSQISDISSYTTTIGTVYVFAVSLSGDVWVSSNGGSTFATIGSAIPAQLYGSAVGSNGNSFAVGTGPTTPYPTRIYRSSSSSTSAAPYTVWSDFTPKPKSPAFANVLLTSVSTFDGTNVITVGFGGMIYYSSDGGATWSSVLAWSGANLQCVSNGASLVAMAAGDAETLILTTNGALSSLSFSPYGLL